MSQYIVSARKYRPDSFESLIGQDTIARTLSNSIKRGQLAHAYLFCGPRGVGKTTTARIFAKMINCAHPGPDMEPCGECESCISFQEGRSYCIHEMDAASNNSVDDIKALMDQVQVPPQVGKYSVYIIDEVHMLSQAAFNAFLKTLEEPPAHAIFILATTEKHKILPTILSRFVMMSSRYHVMTPWPPLSVYFPGILCRLSPSGASLRPFCSPSIPLPFPYNFPTKLYTSYKAHINLIQGSYELNDKNFNVWKNYSAPISRPISWLDLTHDGYSPKDEDTCTRPSCSSPS